MEQIVCLASTVDHAPFAARGTAWALRNCAALVLCLATGISSSAQTFKSLFSFNSTDGSYPFAPMMQGTDGNLYGTTDTGGEGGLGTVFRIGASGNVTTLHSFSTTGGAYVETGLILAADGNFYGTTIEGGSGTYCSDDGCGTVFKITPRGKTTTIYSFCSQSNCADGSAPSSLVQAIDGSFWGTTGQFGANGDGTIFRITADGTLTTMHTFDGADGQQPFGGVVQAFDGNFYGITYSGGTTDSGTVFQITPAGALTTLHSFLGTDGALPVSGLVLATDQSLYGTTSQSGAYNAGTFFRITVGGVLTTLHNFDAATEGSYSTSLLQATDGKFYGSNAGGGVNGYGTVYSLTGGGSLSVLHSFDSTDGAYPYGGLVQATNGGFYGTTYQGGQNNAGTVFGLSVGLGPFVRTVPAARPVGATVLILGMNLSDATSVTFNGTAATFSVVSDSLIQTTVPAGATSGPVVVAGFKRTLRSNAAFRVD